MKKIKKLIVLAMATTMLLGATLTVNASGICPACKSSSMVISTSINCQTCRDNIGYDHKCARCFVYWKEYFSHSCY